MAATSASAMHGSLQRFIHDTDPSMCQASEQSAVQGRLLSHCEYPELRLHAENLVNTPDTYGTHPLPTRRCHPFEVLASTWSNEAFPLCQGTPESHLPDCFPKCTLPGGKVERAGGGGGGG